MDLDFIYVFHNSTVTCTCEQAWTSRTHLPEIYETNQAEIFHIMDETVTTNNNVSRKLTVSLSIPTVVRDLIWFFISIFLLDTIGRSKVTGRNMETQKRT